MKLFTRLDENTRATVMSSPIKPFSTICTKRQAKEPINMFLLCVHSSKLVHIRPYLNTYICSHFQCRCLQNDVDHSQEERRQERL